MSILEALAAEKPVIITTGCNFPQISKARAGTCVPPKTDNLKNAITEMLSKPPDQLAAIGKNGKKFVADNYTWQIAAKKYITLLNNIINNENIPHQNQLNNTIP
jgi:glycosyltransferase involved in cell wall biosynthesis